MKLKTRIPVMLSALALATSQFAWAQSGPHPEVGSPEYNRMFGVRPDAHNAGPRGDRRDDRRADRRDDRRDDRRADRRDDRRDDRHDDRRSGWHQDDRGRYYGYDEHRLRPSEGRHGAGPDHRFYRGSRLPREWRQSYYVVDDWRGHRLPPPRPGYVWYQTGADYVLVALATGLIAQVLLSQ